MISLGFLDFSAGCCLDAFPLLMVALGFDFEVEGEAGVASEAEECASSLEG